MNPSQTLLKDLLLSAARQLEHELKSRPACYEMGIVDPRRIEKTETGGWCTGIGGPDGFEVQVWLDRVTGHPGLRLYAGVCTDERGQMPRLRNAAPKSIRPVRTITRLVKKDRTWRMRNPLSVADMNRPVLEKYRGEQYLGLYNAAPSIAGKRDRGFTQRAANLLESVARKLRYSPGKGDDRRKVRRIIRERQGQPAFRRLLMQKHYRRCQVSGCRVERLLDACHIHAYREEKDNDIQNGLLLRTDLHTLFDLGLLWIESTGNTSLRVRVKSSVRDPLYRDLDGIELETDGIRPSANALQQHRELVVRHPD